MITKDKLYSIQWTDVILKKIEIYKNNDNLDLKLSLVNDSNYYIIFHNCFSIRLNQYGYMIGNESIYDLDFSKYQKNNDKVWANIELNQIVIKLNSGSEILCLTTKDSEFEMIM